jgi:hypothetical protein
VTGRGPAIAQPGYSLPVFDRLAPAPPPSVVNARIDLHTGPGDVVVDLFGRGAWVARAAVDRQRRAVSLESNPLTRMLAEVVLRPPDVRHLDAAFQGLAASPRRESSLKVAIGDLFATRCATCGNDGRRMSPLASSADNPLRNSEGANAPGCGFGFCDAGIAMGAGLLIPRCV